MPLAVLIYHLPGEQTELDMLQDAPKIHAALGDVWNKLRSKLKYEELSEAESEAFEQVRTWMCEAAEEWGIEIP